MFSYVAKSLLSKTLQTFLRKYLENIELDSINYGSSSLSSASASADSSSSGWGVRLSNVKLREGMELVKLPGKRKRIVVIKKKIRKSKNKKCYKENRHDGDKTMKCMNPSALEKYSNATNLEIKSNLSHNNDVQEGRNLRHPSENHRNRSLSSGSEVDYLSSAPSTPTQQRNILCGATSSFCLNSHSKKAAVQLESQLDVKNMPLLPFDKEVNTERQSFCTDNVSSTSNNSERRIAVDLESSFSQIYSKNEMIGEFDSADDNTDDQSYTEIEEEHVVEDHMSFVVGAGGIIGTLNIRLIGKELHVTVEDAHLIIEAITLETANEKENDEKKMSNTTTATKPPLVKSNSYSQEAILCNEELKNENDSISEKVMKKCMLARYLSMIPHLFLRCCRVSLILPADLEVLDENESTYSACDDCTVLEFGIDFLSVTSGDDFMDVLRFDTGNLASESTRADTSLDKINMNTCNHPSLSSNGKDESVQKCKTKNVFSRKRVRTGKGPEGGIWLKILSPNHVTRVFQQNSTRLNRKGVHSEKWARQKFLDRSDGFFFRCSGIDLQAKMLVEVKKDLDDQMIAAWSCDYDDYTIDSMLFGVDYVDPISLAHLHVKEKMKQESCQSQYNYRALSENLNDSDSNGIQHIDFSSNFHWIAKKRHKNGCPNDSKPLNECHYCWDLCVSMNARNSSKMDCVMPLPGFVFSLHIVDPLELNVDRDSLEAIGYIVSLLNEKNVSEDKELRTCKRDQIQASTADSKGQKLYVNDSTWVFDEESFPKYMQPDSIYLSGIYVSKVTARIHAMRPTLQHDSSFQFHYWEMISQSLFFEDKEIDSENQSIHDISILVGSLQCTDYSGVCEKHLILSRPSPLDVAIEPPFTASEVLDITPPTVPKNNSLIVRVVCCGDPQVTQSNAANSMPSISYVQLKAGLFDIEVDDNVFINLSHAYNEAMFTLFNEESKDETKKCESEHSGYSNILPWLFEVSVRGCNLLYSPFFCVKMPETEVKGISKYEGFSFETFLQEVSLQYGSRSVDQVSSQLLSDMFTLPETLRMHILIYVDNLEPLEQVLQIKTKKASAFMRSHTINKKLTELGSLLKKEKMLTDRGTSRRENLLKQLKALDDDALETLLVAHNKLLAVERTRLQND